MSELVVSEYSFMYNYAMKLCRDKMDAEDLVGDSIVKMLCSRENFDTSRPFRPWASVIIYNTYITRCNHDSLIGFVFVDESMQISASDAADSRTLMSEILSVIRRCRRQSTTIDCVLMYASGFTYDEIAEHFGIPHGTVRSRINYGRKMLRKCLYDNTLNKV